MSLEQRIKQKKVSSFKQDHSLQSLKADKNNYSIEQSKSKEISSRKPMVVNWFDDPKESKITAADMISERKAAVIGASQSEH